jgi:hypothetical protein
MTKFEERLETSNVDFKKIRLAEIMRIVKATKVK